MGPQPPGQPHRLAVVLSRRRLLAARVLDGVLGLAVGAVERVVVITPLAADQDPGQGPLTGQPPTGRRRPRSRPAGLTTHPRRATQQAVQLHSHQQLGADPTGLGQPTGLQAAGQLGQGHRPAAGPTARITSVGWAGQRANPATKAWPA